VAAEIIAINCGRSEFIVRATEIITSMCNLGTIVDNKNRHTNHNIIARRRRKLWYNTQLWRTVSDKIVSELTPKCTDAKLNVKFIESQPTLWSAPDSVWNKRFLR
jgi:hypothetical protein